MFLFTNPSTLVNRRAGQLEINQLYKWKAEEILDESVQTDDLGLRKQRTRLKMKEEDDKQDLNSFKLLFQVLLYGLYHGLTE